MSSTPAAELDRRRFPRLHAPVYCRELGVWSTGPARRVIDVSVSGARVYSDVRHPAGTRLEVEILLPDGESVVLPALVMWCEALVDASPAPFDIGLQFVDPSAAALARLGTALRPEG